MKITIFYKFQETPWGGANQFLKALRNYFRQVGCYEEDAELADVLLFVSYPFNNEVLYRKVKRIKKNKNVIVVNRMNGPIFLYRGKDIEVDRINFVFNKSVADGTVFQTQWSRKKCFELGMESNKHEIIIMNAPDPDIFYPLEAAKKINYRKRVKLIATSWSSNPKKGFDVYQYLDENLDFTRYEMAFIGRSPFKFKNIKHIPVLHSRKLAEELRASDIFIFASKLETCSNSLLEALCCRLPVVARNNSSQPEIVGRGGILFEGEKDILGAIDKVVSNYNYFVKSIDVPDINQVGEAYYKFCEEIYGDVRAGTYAPKQWKYYEYLKFMTKVYSRKYSSNITNRIERLVKV